MKAGQPKEPEYVRRFAGGSVPDDQTAGAGRHPPLPGANVARSCSSICAALETAQLTTKPNAEAPWVYEEWFQVLAWHEAHHHGQAHLTFNLYRALHEPSDRQGGALIDRRLRLSARWRGGSRRVTHGHVGLTPRRSPVSGRKRRAGLANPCSFLDTGRIAFPSLSRKDRFRVAERCGRRRDRCGRRNHAAGAGRAQLPLPRDQVPRLRAQRGQNHRRSRAKRTPSSRSAPKRSPASTSSCRARRPSVSREYQPDGRQGRRHRHRQLQRLAHGPRRAAGRARGQRRRPEEDPQGHRRQPELLDHPDGGRPQAAARPGPDQARRRLDLSGVVAARGPRACTSSTPRWRRSAGARRCRR